MYRKGAKSWGKDGFKNMMAKWFNQNSNYIAIMKSLLLHNIVCIFQWFFSALDFVRQSIVEAYVQYLLWVGVGVHASFQVTANGPVWSWVNPSPALLQSERSFPDSTLQMPGKQNLWLFQWITVNKPYCCLCEILFKWRKT